MKNQMFGKPLVALLAGLLFATGLVLSGMTQTAKVLGFLNVLGLLDRARWGAWDPSLAFVMGGALSVTLVAYKVTPRADKRPWLEPRFDMPTRRDIDKPLVVGAVLFGVGWGLVGYCPGPALASVLSGGRDVLLFTACMALGMALAKWFQVVASRFGAPHS